MEIRKGDVFLANLDPVMGHEQGGRRPVVVVQNDAVNPALDTVLVAPLTANLLSERFLQQMNAAIRLAFDV